MMRRQLLSLPPMLLLIFLAGICDVECKAVSSSTKNVGLITTRLSPKELEKWKAIEQIVFAEDANRQPLHPTLRGLWEWVETSGHVVYVEVIRAEPVTTCTAGHFMVERFDPLGERHITVIKLNLGNINQAYVGPETRRANGLVPFHVLDRKERYAEVLGHELAHAVHILTSLERIRMVEELVQQTNQMLLSQHHQSKSVGLAPELKRRLTRRDAFLRELEDQAEAMEKVVWEELTARKPERLKLPFSFR